MSRLGIFTVAATLGLINSVLADPAVQRNVIEIAEIGSHRSVVAQNGTGDNFFTVSGSGEAITSTDSLEDWIGPLNSGSVRQTGHSQHAELTIAGEGHFLEITQSGSENFLNARMAGTGHTAIIAQSGSRNSVQFSQSGQSNSLSIRQGL